MIGRFYFTPRIADLPMINWTAGALERELNAALWGNDFRYLAKFRVRTNTKYKIGPIAQDSFQGVEKASAAGICKETPFDQYSYCKHESLFSQVQIDMSTDWHTYLELLDDREIKAGGFDRRVGNC